MSLAEYCVSLDSVDANALRKWGSAWLDLIHADSALEAHRSTPATQSNLFVRRALWESAVVSYARVAQGDRKRKIPLSELFIASGDPKASEFHDTIMGWRHGHVVHRSDANFESVDVLLCFDDLPDPAALRLVIETAVGPHDDDHLVDRFQAHIVLLRNTIWESFMAPMASRIVDRTRRRPVNCEESTPSLQPTSAGRLVATLGLWERSRHED